MGKKKRVEAAKAPDAGGGWIMTYADLMSLLMAFFVMLLAMADMDKKKFEEVGKSMKLALGSPITENTDSVSDQFKPFDEQSKKEFIEHKVEKNMFEKKIQETKDDAKKLEEELKEKIKENKIEIITHGRMIIIRLMAEGVFDSGKADIKSDFWPAIQKIKNQLQSVKGDILVSGYTDNIPIENDQFRSNWELSAARAYSVIDHLVGGLKLPADRFVLRGFGETRALMPNDTAENQAKNRRVEILIDQRDPVDKTNEISRDSMIDSDIPDAPIPKQLEKVLNGDTSQAMPAGSSTADHQETPVPQLLDNALQNHSAPKRKADPTATELPIFD